MSNQNRLVSEKIKCQERKAEYGFLGIGGCGGNIANLFYQKGYPAFFINSSAEDLASLEGVAEGMKYHLHGGVGTAQDRSASKALFKKNLSRVLEVIKENLRVKILFLVGSTGGGTGSGALPVLAKYLAMETDMSIVVVAVLPANSESFQKRINSYEFLAELEKLHDGASFILDNDSHKNIMKVNEDFCYQLDKLLTNDSHSVRGNVDRQEITHLLTVRGMTILSVLPPTQVKVESIRASIENGIYAPMEDDKVVRYIGLIQPEPVISPADLHVFTGTPQTDYLGYGSQKCICILSGLTLPYTRLEEIYDNAVKEKMEMEKRFSQAARPRLKAAGDLVLDFGGEDKRGKTAKSAGDWFDEIPW